MAATVFDQRQFIPYVSHIQLMEDSLAGDQIKAAQRPVVGDLRPETEPFTNPATSNVKKHCREPA